MDRRISTFLSPESPIRVPPHLALRQGMRIVMQNLAQRRAATSQRIAPEAIHQPPLHAERTYSETVAQETTLVDALVRQLAELGVEEAFGVSGGSIALLYDAVANSSIHLRHFRHESGAAFAATEGYFASGKPTLVFATTGPGLLNTLTGITAAKWEGAKVILVSGHTSSPQRGRWASQETSSYTLPQDAFYGHSPLFDLAVRLESPAEFPEVMRRLHAGLARPGGFVAHVCLPMSVQSSRVGLALLRPAIKVSAPTAAREEVLDCARLLRSGTFAVWAGFGALKAAPEIRELIERSGAKIFCSPRAKGLFPEQHPQYLGVSGLGGHDEVTDFMVQEKPSWVLVLGTRLGEATSFWDRDLLPSEGFIHVDIDPSVPGTAYPDFPTLAIHAEVGRFVRDLLEHLPDRRTFSAHSGKGKILSFEEAVPIRPSGRTPIRPQILMHALQRVIVDRTDAFVLAECGNSFAWCNHHLRFAEPGRYRVSTLFGSMGHAAAGVVGAAIAAKRKAFAVVGDGAMLMNSEVNTAVQYRAAAVWIVLNDAGYGMCRDGQRMLGLTAAQVDFPRVDFVAWARAQGAQGVCVASEDMLEVALQDALDAEGPFVIDVTIDPHESSPLLKRFESLIKQGSSKNVAGWEA
jgi:acetolactate synthase I/II/III large subunit